MRFRPCSKWLWMYSEIHSSSIKLTGMRKKKMNALSFHRVAIAYARLTVPLVLRLICQYTGPFVLTLLYRSQIANIRGAAK